jgi:hypothetical protein
MVDIYNDLMIYDCEDEMKKYNLMHQLEYYKNYDINNKGNDLESEDFANYLYNNYNKMDEIELKKNVLKCISLNNIKKVLLDFELSHHKFIPTKMTLTDFLSKAKIIFNRYQGKAGGFLLEDNEWSVHESKSEEFYVKLNELLFVNTLDETDCDNYETEQYLKKLTRKLNTIAENIKVELRYKNEKKNCLVLIWATDSEKIIETKIGL